MSKKKLITLLLALTMILSLATGASAAETTEARVPVTLTVVNTVAPISCTVPAALPVSLVDGYVVCANNAAITNTGKTGAIRVTKVDVQAGTFEIGNFDDFTASKNSIALSINEHERRRQSDACGRRVSGDCRREKSRHPLQSKSFGQRSCDEHQRRYNRLYQ